MRRSVFRFQRNNDLGKVAQKMQGRDRHSGFVSKDEGMGGSAAVGELRMGRWGVLGSFGAKSVGPLYGAIFGLCGDAVF